MSNEELEDDIVLAKFINYMQKALYHKRLNYYRDFERMRECEVSINEIEDYRIKEPVVEDISNMGILNHKDIYLILLYLVNLILNPYFLPCVYLQTLIKIFLCLFLPYGCY